jgi:plasmid stability protein
MSKMIQVRNVSDELHAELTRRAKLRGQTLSDYIKALLDDDVAVPPREEVFARIHSREPVELSVPAAELIRQAREERESHLAESLDSSLTRRPSSNTSSEQG